MGLQLSGHWLPSLTPGYRYDLLAALLVPVPGFAMARRQPSVTMRDGQLVASAVPVQFADCGCGCGDATHEFAPGGDVPGPRPVNVISSAELQHLASIERRLNRLEAASRGAIVASLRGRITPE